MFKKDVLARAACLIGAIVFTTTVHEVFHLLVGRWFGIPAIFLSFTSVGISPADVHRYSPIALAWMNGLAPLLSVILFGLGPAYILHRSKMQIAEPWRSLLGWAAIFNLPYLGLQMMLAVNLSSANGGGSDLAAVTGLLGVPPAIRFFIGASGYLVFVYSLIVLGRIFGSTSGWPRFWVKAYTFWILGFISVCCGDLLLLSGRQGPGMSLVALGGFVSLGIGGWLLTERNSRREVFWRDWLLPGLVGTLAMAVVGLVLNNDYANFWLIMLPSILVLRAMASTSARPLQSELPGGVAIVGAAE